MPETSQPNAKRSRRKKTNHRKGVRRRCGGENCPTILSAYNKGDKCHVCERKSDDVPIRGAKIFQGIRAFTVPKAPNTKP